MHPEVRVISDHGPIRYVPLTKNHIEEVLHVMHHGYFIQEALSIATGLSEHPEAILEFDELIVKAAEDGVSIVALEKITGKVAGCTINRLQVAESIQASFFDDSNFKHPCAKAYSKLNSEVDKTMNVFDLLHTSCYLECMFGCVLPEFGGQGVGTDLIKLSARIVQNLKNGRNVKESFDGKPVSLHPVPTAVVGIATCEAAAKAFNKLEFAKIIEVHVHKQKTIADLITRTSPVQSISLYCKALK